MRKMVKFQITIKDKQLNEADHTIIIPMQQGMVQSLNVSVSAALILYEAERQRKKAGMYKKRHIDEATYRKLLFEWSWPKIAHHWRIRQTDCPEIDLESGEIIGGVPR